MNTKEGTPHSIGIGHVLRLGHYLADRLHHCQGMLAPGDEGHMVGALDYLMRTVGG